MNAHSEMEARMNDRRTVELIDYWCRRGDLNPHRVTPTGF